MRIVTFGPHRRVGVLADDQVVDVHDATRELLRAEGHVNAAERAAAWAPPRLVDFIEAGQTAIEMAERAVKGAREGRVGSVGPVAEVHLRAPWPGRRIACAGGNFADHLFGMVAGSPDRADLSLESIGRKAREEGQWGFWKVPHEVAGPGDAIAVPRRCTFFDYEGEVAIVLGRRGSDIPAARLDAHVWGVTLVNDWSIRDRQGGPRRPMSYNVGKNFDGCLSMGPCIVVGELDCHDVTVETRVNGEIRQNFNTGEMLYDFGEILEFLSADFTFVPGDVICGGTGAGTAADSSPREDGGQWGPCRFLSPGDLVEVAAADIGVLPNQIVSAASVSASSGPPLETSSQEPRS